MIFTEDILEAHFSNNPRGMFWECTFRTADNIYGYTFKYSDVDSMLWHENYMAYPAYVILDMIINFLYHSREVVSNRPFRVTLKISDLYASTTTRFKYDTARNVYVEYPE